MAVSLQSNDIKPAGMLLQNGHFALACLLIGSNLVDKTHIHIVLVFHATNPRSRRPARGDSSHRPEAAPTARAPAVSSALARAPDPSRLGPRARGLVSARARPRPRACPLPPEPAAFSTRAPRPLTSGASACGPAATFASNPGARIEPKLSAPPPAVCLRNFLMIYWQEDLDTSSASKKTNSVIDRYCT
ncbi:hypothetical protein BS78_02G254300 [Paspalum vaginatum]|nr:hypothetical protein BS78_02G254300 [Paspalum vaginatum]